MVSKIFCTVLLAGVIGLVLSGEVPVVPAVHEPADPPAPPAPTSAPAPGGACVGKEANVAGVDCKSYLECVEGTWKQVECGWGKFYNEENHACEYNWFYRHCKL